MYLVFINVDISKLYNTLFSIMAICFIKLLNMLDNELKHSFNNRFIGLLNGWVLS